MEDVKTIITNYEMGLISASQMCMQIATLLSYVGVSSPLVEQINIELTPLARFLVDNFEKHQGYRMEDFQSLKKNYSDGSI